MVGRGSSDSNRSNAFAVDWDGNVRVYNDMYVDCYGDSTGGTKLVRQTRTINGYALSSNVTLDASDVGAIADNKIQSGTISATTIPANSYKDVTVKFPKSFSSEPVVTVGLRSTSDNAGIGSVSVAVYSVSNTQFVARFFNNGTGKQPAASWIATAL